MYTRSFPEGADRVPLPSGYDGTAFEKEEAECFASVREENEDKGLLSKIPLFKGIRGLDSFKLPFEIGAEELMLIGIALLLFFSKDGDRECAVLIAILLFIK